MKTRWCDWKTRGTPIPVFPPDWISKNIAEMVIHWNGRVE